MLKKLKWRRSKMIKLSEETVITIEEMVESIEMLSHVSGANLLKITENFPKKGTSVHLVRVIEVEEEKEILIFRDCDGVIITNSMMISGLLKNSIIKASICHTKDEELDSYMLYLNNGNIVIQPIIW
jgi:hypothetical protein